MAERLIARMAGGSRWGPDESGKRGLTKTQKSGNEAKKCLKTKDRLRNLRAKLHLLDAEDERITAPFAPRSNITTSQCEAGTVTSRWLHRAGHRQECYAGIERTNRECL